MRCVCRNARGFTLIELLVVIAIIAILAAILFPVFISARTQSQKAACQSNMKQVAMACFLYADDNSGFLPMCQVQGPGPVGWDTGRTLWGMAIRKYAANKPHIVYCASRPALFVENARYNSQVIHPYKYYHPSTIGMNVALGNQEGLMAGEAKVWIPPTRTGQLRAPSRTLMLADSSMYAYAKVMSQTDIEFWGDPLKVGTCTITPGTSSAGLGDRPDLNPLPNRDRFDYFDPGRHGGHINVCCADGHVVTKDRKWLLTPHSTNPNDSDYTWWDRR